MNTNVSYTWAKRIDQRFQFTSHNGAIALYSESGEIQQTGNFSFGFTDGIMHFVDDSTTVIVTAHKDSRAVFLVEIGEKIIAALQLSKDRGLLIKHLNERASLIPIAYKNTAVALLVLPKDQPFEGYIRVKSVQSGKVDQSGPVRINDIANPRIYVPESMILMYQHLRNVEKAGKRPVNRHTFAEHEFTTFSNRYPHNDIGKGYRMFTADEAYKWLEKSKNRTPVEEALQREFVLSSKQASVIAFPKQQLEYVKVWCRELGFAQRPICDVGDLNVSDVSSDDSSSPTNSENSSVSVLMQSNSGAVKATSSKKVDMKTWKRVQRLQRMGQFNSGNIANWLNFIVQM